MTAMNNGTTIDKTITFIVVGLLAIAFMVFTVFGMKRIQATAERSGRSDKSIETPVQIDISGVADTQ